MPSFSSHFDAYSQILVGWHSKEIVDRLEEKRKVKAGAYFERKVCFRQFFALPRTNSYCHRLPTRRHAQLLSNPSTPKLHLSRSSSLSTATRRLLFISTTQCSCSRLSTATRRRLYRKVDLANGMRIVAFGKRIIVRN